MLQYVHDSLQNWNEMQDWVVLVLRLYINQSNTQAESTVLL